MSNTNTSLPAGLTFVERYPWEVRRPVSMHIQDWRIPGVEGRDSSKAEDLLYSETATASGGITLFRKIMQYDSKIAGVLPVVHEP
jgi:hypothetical protein